MIAFGLAWAEFLGKRGGAPIGIDVEGHGRQEELAADVDLSNTVGWFTAKYPVSLAVAGLSWAQVVAGKAALGDVVKNAKEQLRALPDGLTYGLLRYLNTDVDLAGSDPPIGFNYFGRMGAPAADGAGDGWGISQDGASITAMATAVPMPLMHTVELNAGTVDTETGPHLHAEWTWAPSILDEEQIRELSSLWFEALAGICAHVRSGGGGLTPSDIPSAHLSQQQIDELARQYEVADILPLTALQQGSAVPCRHGTAERATICMRSSSSSPWRAHWTLDACVTRYRRWSPGTRTWWPGSANSTRNRCRSSPPIPRCRGAWSI